MKNYFANTLSKRYYKYCLFSLFTLTSVSVLGQEFNQFTNADGINPLIGDLEAYRTTFFDSRSLAMGLSFGAVVELGKKNNSSYRLFIAGSILKNFTRGDAKFMAALQTEFEFFRGGIGSSELRQEYSKFNIEWRNYPQFIFGFNNGNSVKGRPLTPALGQSMSALYDPLDYSISLGTIFVNGINHSRNQQMGFLQLGIVNFNGSYINDGPPFHLSWLPLGDEFDRYWTGNLDLGLYFLDANLPLTHLGFRYTRFTGYQENSYELSDNFKLKNILYKDHLVQFRNKGRYQYRLGFYNFGTVNFSVYQPKYTGLQEFIHAVFNYPFHPNITDRYFTVGTEFNYRNVFFN